VIVFAKAYERALIWSAHPRAVWYLGAVSFAESSFFPIPPDVLLAPMVLARPQRAWKLAAWTTLTSVAGGVLGLTLGAVAIDSLQPLLQDHGYWDSYLRARQWFATWGFWAVIVAGFSPIPYKVFALAAGAASMLLPLFVVASIVGRGGRFFLVAALIALGGRRMEQTIRAHIDTIGWTAVGLAGGALLLTRVI
jgi:membrane protein YqaA with SNARE-associated domain